MATPSPRSGGADGKSGKNLTLKSGAPIGDKLNSLLVGPLGPQVIADTAYIEETAHFNRERIPERVVHAKGAAALGKFVVTSKEICNYSKASLFGELGKSTPVIARFSHVTGESGIADTTRDVRGFAVKFHTEQGNWDLVGNNLPVFFIRDPINFVSLIHSQKRDPQTHLRSPNSFWDFVAQLPESLHTILMLFSERGIPDGFRHMHGFGVNTFKLVNEKGEHFYAKFHWICNQKIRNLTAQEADIIAGKDPDYSLRDLQVNIHRKNFPSWTLKFQVMSPKQADECEFNAFDVTKVWPHNKFPLREIGKMTLDSNVSNHFQQVEQVAFSPSNLVPGIEVSPDKMLMGRLLSYPDAQRYRLGANYADLPVNRPTGRCPVMTPTYCDGPMCSSNMPPGVPNYVPNGSMKSLHIFDDRYLEHKQEVAGHLSRFDLSNNDNFTQPRDLVSRVLGEESRKTLAQSIAKHFAGVTNEETRTRVSDHFSQVDADFAKMIQDYAATFRQAARFLP